MNFCDAKVKKTLLPQFIPGSSSLLEKNCLDWVAIYGHIIHLTRSTQGKKRRKLIRFDSNRSPVHYRLDRLLSWLEACGRISMGYFRPCTCVARARYGHLVAVVAVAHLHTANFHVSFTNFPLPTALEISLEYFSGKAS